MIGLGGVIASIMTNSRRPRFVVLPGFKATSCLTVVLLICLETVLLSTVSNCAKTFYMHWNTTNSIFRIDNTDHIIDVNKGNLAFEYDQVHIICPVYELGTFDNETEKYIIYNVSKVEYETCRITNANPRIIAICDKPQKLMFFTITFRPFTPQPGGLEFLPGNDYYFISTSSKDDLHRRIGGRCSTNNMKVVFKVCCAPEEPQQNTSANSQLAVINNGNGHHHQQQQQQSSSHHGTGVFINTNIDPNNRQIAVGNGAGTGASNGGSGSGSGNGGTSINGGRMIPPLINTNSSNVVQSTITWPGGWSNNNNAQSTPVTTTLSVQPFHPYMSSPRPIVNNGMGMIAGSGDQNSNYPPSHNKPTKKTNEYDKHPNEVVKNEELTYNRGSSSIGGTFGLNNNINSRVTSTLFLVTLIIFIKVFDLHSCRRWCQR